MRKIPQKIHCILHFLFSRTMLKPNKFLLYSASVNHNAAQSHFSFSCLQKQPCWRNLFATPHSSCCLSIESVNFEITKKNLFSTKSYSTLLLPQEMWRISHKLRLRCTTTLTSLMVGLHISGSIMQIPFLACTYPHTL